ncbi:3-phosphoshikimate 1-carboxyvinyltransferase [Anaeromyxobacter sp. PSR-1]|uniref:3-phosphoshikimate 1-carboxyvinyltransferase n=1 Tax=unclassified Anaeromyxobacter TaxID=2620896 RepID=UPI0005E437A2|nr:3-phosphoshikimate 1-carboxyvinyltransferase [Anaeromyxobacter sp. PSR-1]GAO04246.1 3-phosphoshikimate 1-carboxyvinyltransferase [Anaeromyxobacter sp. PSR-1]
MSAAPTSGPLTCRRAGPLRGAIEVPGDKSISHRSLLFGALSTGETRVTGLLDAEDVHSTRQAVEALGATVRAEGGEVVVTPPATLREPGDVIDCGNSGTSLRLLTGVLSGVPGLSVLTGDASLRRRPVRRVIDPLRVMGANLSARDGDRLPPVVVRGGPLRGARHVLPVASAQVKSAILLAGLFAEGETSVVEPEKSRDHTERMLRGMGVPVRVSGLEVSVSAARPAGGRVDVPGDISSAAFFLCGAAALPGSEVTVRNLGVNETRTGLLDVLRAMGADVRLEHLREVAGEPRADVTVRADRLEGTEIRGATIPRLIDELPVVMVMATQARGRTVIRDAKELRVKESDRLAAMGETLARAGARIELYDDGCAIDGPTPLRGVEVRTRLDHRIAMSMAVAQLFCGGEPVVLDDVACVATSFPSFFRLLDQVSGRAPGGGAP